MDVCELAVQTQPDILLWAFTKTAHCQTWRLRDFVDPIIRTKQYMCRNGMVHHAYSVDESGDVVMEDASALEEASSSLERHLHGNNEFEVTTADQSIVPGFDGNASGVLKRMHKALAVECDPWVDFLDLRGASDAWFEDDGSIIAWYGTSE